MARDPGVKFKQNGHRPRSTLGMYYWKAYWHYLYIGLDPNRKRILTSASDAKLDTLIRFLFFVSNGEIKINKKSFDKLEKKHMNHIKKRFEKKKAVQSILKAERLEKIKSLLKLLLVLPHLLSTLFP